MSNDVRTFDISEFNAVTSRTTLLPFVAQIRKRIYLWYKEYKNQDVYYKIENSDLLSYADDIFYKKFGIILSNDSSSFEEREYLIIIPEESLRDLKSFVTSYCASNLPSNTSPLWYIVEKSYSTYDEYMHDANIIKEVLPFASSFVEYKELKDIANREQGIINIKQSLSKYNVVEINEQIDRLDVIFKGFNDTTLSSFSALIGELKANYKPGMLYIYTGDNDDMYLNVASYLSYFHKIPCYIFSHNREYFYNKVRMLVFDNNRMLVEDQIRVLKNYPEVLVDISNYGGFFVINQGIALNVACRYIPINSIKTGDIVSVRLNLDKVDVINVDEMYNINSHDRSIAKKANKEIVSLLGTFEERLGIENKILNLTNCFFFEVDGEICLAYIEDYSVKMKATVVSITPGRGNTQKDYNLSELKRLLPITVFEDHKGFLKVLNKIVFGKDSSRMLRTSYVIPETSKGCVLEFFYTNGKNVIFNFDDMLPVQVGLWWREAYSLRVGLSEKLLKVIKLKKIRSNSDYISCFGGRHPYFDGKLFITEKMLRS